MHHQLQYIRRYNTHSHANRRDRSEQAKLMPRSYSQCLLIFAFCIKDIVAFALEE